MDKTENIKFFDDMGMQYEEAFGHDPGLTDFVNSSLDLLEPGSSILELGSGTGKPTAQLAAKRGHKLHGIDFSSVMVDIARRQVPTATFERIDMFNFQPAAPYDAMFAMFSLFRLEKDRMRNLARSWKDWVKPGGYLFIGMVAAEDYPAVASGTVPIDADGFAATDVPLTFMGREAREVLFTKLGWKSFLEDGGFEIVRTKTVPFQPPAEAQCDMEPHYYITARRMAD